MINWNNMDTLASFQELLKAEPVNLAQAMEGEKGAERVKIQCSYGRRDGLQLCGETGG